MSDDVKNLSQVDSNSENENEQQNTEYTEQLDQSKQEAAKAEQEAAEKSYQARNFAELREQRERAERERDELARRLQQLEQEKKQEEEKNPFDFGGSDEDLAEIKHLKMLAKKQQELERQMQQYQQQSTQQTAEARLKSQFNDLEKVVTDENIRRLQQEDPDLAQSLQYNPDPYTKYAAAYKAIKRMGIYQEDTYGPERQKAQYNANKPRPLASVSPQKGNSPLSRANAFANGLTSDLREKLIKEMQEARKKY